MLKKIIRSDFIEKRLQLAGEELSARSDAMLEQFDQLQLPSCKWLLSYYPLRERNEFDVATCEKKLLVQMPQMKVAWPRVDPIRIGMDAVGVTPDSIFAKNKFNILEPLSGERVDPEEIDLIFVPLVIFDQRGYRVGYGKGFYDRYLLRCRPSVIKLGFCFFEALPAIRDIDEFDVPLSFCITPRRIYEF